MVDDRGPEQTNTSHVTSTQAYIIQLTVKPGSGGKLRGRRTF